MGFNLIITPPAAKEEIDAYIYYEGIRPGPGDEFVAVVKKYYDIIADNPHYFSYVSKRKKLRDVKIERFPFLVVYLVSKNDVIVVSLRNTYRKPYI